MAGRASDDCTCVGTRDCESAALAPIDSYGDSIWPSHSSRYRMSNMAKAFLLFDFGSDEDAAQKARHRVEAWRQAFRLGNKVQFKIERAARDAENAEDSEKSESKAKEKTQPIRVLVQLDFSPHEKHLFQTWLARVPSEEPFSSIKPETIQRGSANFEETSDRFDSLD